MRNKEKYGLPDERRWGRDARPVVEGKFWVGVRNAAIISLLFFWLPLAVGLWWWFQ